MSTTLLNSLYELQKQLNDYWYSTTTSAGSSTGITITDSALIDKDTDWINDESYAMPVVAGSTVSTAYLYQERRIASLSTAGVVTLNRGYSAQVPSGSTYVIQRLFSPSEYRRALIYAARHGYPYIHSKVNDTNLTAGNWLRDPSFEWNWTTTALNTYWVVTTATQAKNTTFPYYTRGATSLKLDTAAGYSSQTDSLNTELAQLRGKTVTFTAWVWCDTASCARLGILYDGTNLTYSDYHDGDSDWQQLSVTYTLDTQNTGIAFRLYHAVAAGTSYFDDARVYGATRDKVYIGDLGLSEDKPYQVWEQSDSDLEFEPWNRLHNYWVDKDAWLHLTDANRNYRLKVVGLKYLDFLDSSGDASTDWTATIDINSPQTDILVAEAALHLCDQKTAPGVSSGSVGEWANARTYWEDQLKKRRSRFGMKTPSATTHWGK